MFRDRLRNSLLGLLFFVGSGTLGKAAEPAASGPIREIFNGHDLSNWDGDPRYWSVKNGVIRGETTLRSLPLSNTFLIWRGGELKDFELRIKFRIQNGNSGVQFRSRESSPWKMSGYQAEIENKPGKVGFLYEERGRKYLANVGEVVEMRPNGERKVKATLGSQQEMIANGYFKPKDWNQYVITARGNRIEQTLNGFKTIELIDEDVEHRALSGLLALQIHAGAPMLVEFKDIYLKSF